MNFSFNLNRTANASAWRLLPNGWDFVAFPLIIGGDRFSPDARADVDIEDPGHLARSGKPA
jgi:hypothetical protein